MKTNGPPLKVWFYFFGAFFAFQVIVYCYVKAKNKKQEIDINDNKSLEIALNALKASNKKSFNVVIIGSSLVGRGVECQEERNSAINSQETTSIHLIKIWRSGEPFERFVNNDSLLVKLLEIHPDLICIQTELVAINFYNADQNLTFLNFILNSISSYNKNAIKYCINTFGFKKNDSPEEGPQCLPDGEKKKIDTINYEPHKRLVKKTNDIKFAFDDLKKLERAGIKTVIVDLPRPMKVEEKIFDVHFKRQLQQILDMYKQQFGIEHWKYTGQPMYYRYFLDGGHLNKSGKHIYTEWLLKKIKQEKVL